jgi:hypothetical protein
VSFARSDQRHERDDIDREVIDGTIAAMGEAVGRSLLWEQIGREVDDFSSGIRALPVSRMPRPDMVRAEVESRFDFANPIPLPDLTREVAHLLRE